MYRRYLMIGVAAITLAACTGSNDGEVDTSMTDSAMMSGEPVYVEDGPAPGTQADLVVNVGDRVFFDTDSSNLTQQARMTLENQATWMAQYPSLVVTVEGHADERGTREYNLALGERRANSVKSYLTALGVDSSRISTVSYGKERPAVPGSSPESWSQNRRGVTKVE